ISRDSVRHYGTDFWFRRDKGGWPEEEESRTWDSSLIEDPYQQAMTVDLADPDEGYVFRANKDATEAVTLSRQANDPTRYFSKVPVEQDGSVTLEKDEFYILK